MSTLIKGWDSAAGRTDGIHSTNGAAHVSPAHQGGEDNAGDKYASQIRVTQDWIPVALAAGTANQVVSKRPCRVGKIVVNNGVTSGVLTLYNNAIGLPEDQLAIVDGGSTSDELAGLRCSKGLTVAAGTTGAGVTVFIQHYDESSSVDQSITRPGVNGRPARSPRIVRNLLNNSDYADFSTYSTVETGGSVTVSADTKSVTIALDAAGGECYISKGLPTLTAGKTYALTFELVSYSGDDTANEIMLFTGETLNWGTDSLNPTLSASVANQRMGVIFNYASGTVTLRIGFGPGGNENANARTMVVQNIQLEELGINGASAPSEYVDAAFSLASVSAAAAFNYQIDSSLDGGTTGLLTITAGDTYSVPRSASILCVGDSFGNNSNEWPDKLKDYVTEGAIITDAESSRTIVNAVTSAATSIELGNTDSGAVAPKLCIIQSGVNDILAATATTDPLPAMKTALQSFITDTLVPNDCVPILVAVGPWAANASYDTTKGHQLWTDAWNQWLEEYAAENGYPFYDMYSALEGDSNADQISDTTNGDTYNYNDGDGIHPNAGNTDVTDDGSIRIAKDLETIIRRYYA